MTRLARRCVTIVMIALLFITACSGGGATPAPSSSSTSPTTAPTATLVPTKAPTATSAPTATLAPTATTAPTKAPPTKAAPPGATSSDACVVGTWELSDITAYIASLVSRAGLQVKFAGQDGYVRYTFGSDGKASIEANNFAIRLTGSIQVLPINIAVTIKGTATADYTVDRAGHMTFSNTAGDKLKFSATLNGTDLLSDQSSSQLAALFGVSGAGQKSTTFKYECQGNALTYTPPIANAKPVGLTRVSL